MSVQRLSIGDRLPHDPTHELEVRKVLRVHVRDRVGLERGSIRGCDEERVVLIEDVPSQDGVPGFPETEGGSFRTRYWSRADRYRARKNLDKDGPGFPVIEGAFNIICMERKGT